MQTKKQNKYLYGWKFYVNYGQGWEYETFEETRKLMIENRKAYQENCPYPLRISQGRTINPSYIETVYDGNVCFSGDYVLTPTTIFKFRSKDSKFLNLISDNLNCKNGIEISNKTENRFEFIGKMWEPIGQALIYRKNNTYTWEY